MSEVPFRVFLVIEVEFNESVLPDEYLTAIEKHTEISPTTLKLPWPAAIFPKNIGDEISFSNMIQAEYLVKKFEYIYSHTRGIVAGAVLKATDQTRTFGLGDLLFAADEGFLFESETPVADILREAGLKYTMRK